MVVCSILELCVSAAVFSPYLTCWALTVTQSCSLASLLLVSRFQSILLPCYTSHGVFDDSCMVCHICAFWACQSRLLICWGPKESQPSSTNIPRGQPLLIFAITWDCHEHSSVRTFVRWSWSPMSPPHTPPTPPSIKIAQFPFSLSQRTYLCFSARPRFVTALWPCSHTTLCHSSTHVCNSNDYSTPVTLVTTYTAVHA